MSIFDLKVEDIIQSKELAGFVGACVSLQWARGSTKVEKLWNVLSGTAAAVYLPPPLLHWMGLRHIEGVALGAAFFTGMFAMNWMASLVEWVKTGGWVELLPWRRGK